MLAGACRKRGNEVGRVLWLLILLPGVGLPLVLLCGSCRYPVGAFSATLCCCSAAACEYCPVDTAADAAAGNNSCTATHMISCASFLPASVFLTPRMTVAPCSAGTQQQQHQQQQSLRAATASLGYGLPKTQQRGVPFAFDDRQSKKAVALHCSLGCCCSVTSSTLLLMVPAAQLTGAFAGWQLM